MITFVHNFHHKEKPATIQLTAIHVTSKLRTFKVLVNSIYILAVIVLVVATAEGSGIAKTV
jgi:hypothetical protein